MTLLLHFCTHTQTKQYKKNKEIQIRIENPKKIEESVKVFILGIYLLEATHRITNICRHKLWVSQSLFSLSITAEALREKIA